MYKHLKSFKFYKLDVLHFRYIFEYTSIYSAKCYITDGDIEPSLKEYPNNHPHPFGALNQFPVLYPWFSALGGPCEIAAFCRKCCISS